MKNAHTANQFAGRAIRSIFFAGFGALWLFLSLYAMQRLSAVTVSGILLGALLLLLASVYLLRLARRWPRVPDDPAVGRAFGWVNAIQWTAVAIVAVTFTRLRLDAYIVSAITLIVGLHMFPLARLFRYPLHYAAGGALVAWAVASAMLEPADQLQGITALGTGLILWLSAAVTLALALQSARQTPP